MEDYIKDAFNAVYDFGKALGNIANVWTSEDVEKARRGRQTPEPTMPTITSYSPMINQTDSFFVHIYETTID